MTATTDPVAGDMAGSTSSVAFPVASARATWGVLWRLARPYRRLVAGGTAVLLGATLAALAIPLLLGGVVDVVAGNRPEGDLDWLVVGLVVATLLQGGLFGGGAWAVGRLGELLLTDLREEVLDRALAVPLGDVERAGTGDLIARACGDVDAVSEAMREAIPEIVGSALLVSLTVVGLATVDGRLALAGLAAVPIQAGAARWYLRRSGPVYAAERAAEGARSQGLHTAVSGARTIRSLRLQGRHMSAIRDSSRRTVDLAGQAASVRARFFSALNAAEVVGLGAVLAVSYPLVQGGAITVGGATAAALYFYRLFDPVGVLLSQLDTAQAAGAAMARLVGVASLPAAPIPPTDDPTPANSPALRPVEPVPGAADVPAARSPTHRPPESLQGTGDLPTARSRGIRPAAGAVQGMRPAAVDVSLAGVSFSYDGSRPALRDVDLHIRAGERVALVGPSGAGKSTVATLIAGIHPADRGTVAVGGRDLGTHATTGLARLVTLVTQEVHVFAGSLAANLRLAMPGAFDDELHAALDMVGATPWVEALPDGLATVVGAGGHSLSPTQAQQVALARLVLADPPVAVLDEATAEAGSRGAAVLDDAASTAIAGRTALVIAHRLTQAAAADRVVVLDQGRVVEEGSHESLLAGGGLYAELWAAWSGHVHQSSVATDSLRQ